MPGPQKLHLLEALIVGFLGLYVAIVVLNYALSLLNKASDAAVFVGGLLLAILAGACILSFKWLKRRL